MKSYRKLALFLGLGLLLTPFFDFAKAHAAFNQNLLIDDAIFSNSTTLSAAQIDAFLNSISSSCISSASGFESKVPSGYSPSGGFTFGAFVSAGQVIATSAQIYGINPQVLLTTLEKEQSLVGGQNNFSGYCNNGNEHKYAAAMGYGCPDSGGSTSYSGISLYRRNGVERTSVASTCVNSSSKAGFSQQVIRGAWLLKFGQQRSLGNTSWAVITGSWDNSDDPPSCYSGPMTQGTLKRCQSGSATYFDGYTTIDGSATHMDSGGTAALYWYTPHFHGNQNFVSLFEGWFGPTVGSLVKTPYDPTVYLLNGTTAHAIYSVDILNDYAALGPIRTTNAAEINTYSSGPVLGHLISSTSDNLYFVNASIKLQFPDCSSVVDYGYVCNPSTTIHLNDGLFAKLANGPPMTPLLKSTSNGTVYYMSGGSKRPIISWGDLLSFHVSIINTFTDALVNQLPTNNIPAYGSGSLVKTANSGTVYVVKDISNLLPIGNFVYPQELGLSLNVRTIASSYTVLSGIENKLKCSGLNYLATNGAVFQVSNGMSTNYGFNSGQFLDGGTLCLNVSISSQPLDQFIRVSNGTIYYVSGGQKQPISNYNAYVAHGGSTNNTTQVSDFFASTLPTGSTITN